jgi:predicted DNA binding CopG/RHH family protein
MKTRRHKRDHQVHEFDKRDLGGEIKRSRSAVLIRPKKRSLPTSILLDSSLIRRLKKKAAHRGIGYQTMLKIILHEHVDEY